MRRKLITERGKAASMLAEMHAVEIHVGHQAGRLKANKESLTFCRFRYGQFSAIPAGAAVIVAAFEGIFVVPGMRQRNLRPARIIKRRRLCAVDIGPDEFPAISNRRHTSRLLPVAVRSQPLPCPLSQTTKPPSCSSHILLVKSGDSPSVNPYGQYHKGNTLLIQFSLQGKHYMVVKQPQQ